MEQIKQYLGCLLGAAAGDAMGAPTEMRTKQQIEEYFNGPVTEFKPTPSDTFARGNKPGQITDDFSMAYISSQTILAANGEVGEKTANDAILEWSKNEAFFNQFVGPTSRAAINRLRGEIVEESRFLPVNSNNRGSNGGAMKAAPISLFAHGDIEAAIRLVAIMAAPTHNNNLALAGACAVAAATNAALNGATLNEIICAGQYGARRGNEIGLKQGSELAGPSVEKRIGWAVQLAMQSKDTEQATQTMADYFDCSGMAADSIPVAFGLIAAANGDSVEAIKAAVNVGYDTDSIATMVGGILGAKHGVSAFPDDYLTLIDKVNGYDLLALAKEISECSLTFVS